MRGFLEKVLRTNERTDGGELIGPISASGRGPKISKIQWTIWKIYAKMLILGLKGANLDQKGPKMGGGRFFPDSKPQFSKRRP